jgi:hypothetical protein
MGLVLHSLLAGDGLMRRVVGSHYQAHVDDLAPRASKYSRRAAVHAVLQCMSCALCPRAVQLCSGAQPAVFFNS